MADLVQAWRECCKSKRNTASALRFNQFVEPNLCALRTALLNGSYRPGRSHCFTVTRPKVREVWAASFHDRVVHHLLYNFIAPRFYASFIANSCACIPGRGTLYAAERLEQSVRSITQNWSRPASYLKMDISNFFVAINKPKLFAQLESKILDPFWLDLAHTILFHDPRDGVDVRSSPAKLALVPPHKSLFNAPTDTGLPIGNLSSQFFANVYLDVLDQFCKHQLKAKHYVRYVDDFIILHESPQWLHQVQQKITAWLPERLGVHINPTKTILQPVERGIDFVGHVIKPWRRTPRKRVVATALSRLRTMPASDVFAAGNSYLGQMGQSTHGHKDRAAVAKVLRQRGFVIKGDLSKIYRRRDAIQSN